MNLLVIYVIAVLFLVAVSLIVIFNYWRHRYNRDLTPLFILLFVIAFIGTILLTFAFVTIDAVTPS